MSGGALFDAAKTRYLGTISHKYYDDDVKKTVEEFARPKQNDVILGNPHRHILAIPSGVALAWLGEVFQDATPPFPDYVRVAEHQLKMPAD